MRLLRVTTAVVAVSLVLVACQDGVVDVGTVPEDELDDPETFPALVNGMRRAMARGLGLVQQIGVFAARELNSGAHQGDFGATISQAAGVLNPVENDPQWIALHRARWTAEDGVRRMRRVLGDEAFAESPLAAEALLLAGFANRALGENMCQAVIDGGPAEPRSVHFERAEDVFVEARVVAEAAGDEGMAAAARAGQATVLAWLGQWSQAAALAETIDPGFSYVVRYHDVGVEQYNRVAWGTNPGLRAHTAWGTYYEDYYDETGDPRVAWTTDPEYPNTEGLEPWLIQQKYAEVDAPVEVVSWEEMRLLVAEERLRAGAVDDAMAELDALRDAAGVDRWEVDGPDEAWTALKRERGIELWLEGRRLWDLHRWLEAGTPGEAEDMTGRDTCFPIGATELGTNPNLR